MLFNLDFQNILILFRGHAEVKCKEYQKVDKIQCHIINLRIHRVPVVHTQGNGWFYSQMSTMCRSLYSVFKYLKKKNMKHMQYGKQTHKMKLCVHCWGKSTPTSKNYKRKQQNSIHAGKVLDQSLGI